MPQTRFGAEFAQAFEVHRAISEAVSERAEGSGLIDAAEVVRRLLAEHPADITLTPAGLAEAVVRAAADAGVRVAYQPQLRRRPAYGISEASRRN